MDIVVSYKIRTLEDELKTSPQAADLFIQKYMREGTPIIEEVEGYNRFVWVTHLYFSDEKFENIVVYEDHIKFNYERAEFSHVEGTNIWYKTTIVPYGQTVNYGFVKNDSLLAECGDRLGKIFLDPLNTKVEEVNGLKLSQIVVHQKTPD
jgi:hypothetical protein